MWRVLEKASNMVWLVKFWLGCIVLWLETFSVPIVSTDDITWAQCSVSVTLGICVDWWCATNGLGRANQEGVEPGQALPENIYLRYFQGGGVWLLERRRL